MEFIKREQLVQNVRRVIVNLQEERPKRGRAKGSVRCWFLEADLHFR